MKRFILIAFTMALGINSFAQKTDSVTTPIIMLKGVTKATIEPLIVIDGNKQYARGTSSLGKMDPNNIESINIIKDASSISKYGADGMAGVIEIKTKNGLTDIYNKPIDSSSLNLNGVYGLTIAPNSPPKVIIRNLLLRDSDPKAEPMYVLDGKNVDMISDLKPGLIKSITVLKDSSSTALYGDKGRNGVVIIETKAEKKIPNKN